MLRHWWLHFSVLSFPSFIVNGRIGEDHDKRIDTYVRYYDPHGDLLDRGLRNGLGGESIRDFFEGGKRGAAYCGGDSSDTGRTDDGSGNPSVLRIFELLGKLIGPATQAVGLPTQLIPLLIVKMFSSSAATGLVLDIFKTCGPDSYAGMLTSILMSCTETIFYTMSVYFLAAKVTKTRYTLPGALLATLAGTVASIFLAGKM